MSGELVLLAVPAGYLAVAAAGAFAVHHLDLAVRRRTPGAPRDDELAGREPAR